MSTPFRQACWDRLVALRQANGRSAPHIYDRIWMMSEDRLAIDRVVSTEAGLTSSIVYRRWGQNPPKENPGEWEQARTAEADAAAVARAAEVRVELQTLALAFLQPEAA